MSRTPIATLAGIVFVLAFIVVAVAVREAFGRVPWPIEALYWAVAGLLWVLPVRWLMLWAVGKR